MGFYKNRSYREFERELFNAFSKRVNLLILCVPGMGVTHFIKRFLEKNRSLKVAYITSSGQTLAKNNILDLNFDKNVDALEIADGYFKKASNDQKFAIVINTPYLWTRIDINILT